LRDTIGMRGLRPPLALVMLVIIGLVTAAVEDEEESLWLAVEGWSDLVGCGCLLSASGGGGGGDWDNEGGEGTDDVDEAASSVAAWARSLVVTSLASASFVSVKFIVDLVDVTVVLLILIFLTGIITFKVIKYQFMSTILWCVF
jgi:hypothetical protein